MARQTPAPYKPEWVPFQGMHQAFSLVGSKGTLYWRGTKGWWAQRPGSDGMVGPFSRDHQARKWAEEPARLAHEREGPGGPGEGGHPGGRSGEGPAEHLGPPASW